MKGFVHIFGKEAAPRVRSGSYADGIAGQSLCLPLAVVGPHVNLPSSDHSEVASDENRFASCFLALCAKALIKTYCDFGNTYSHNRKILVVLESLERLVKSTSSALLPKKRASATRQMLPHVSLEEQTLKVLVFPLAKIRHISESTKYSESALSQNKRSICLSVGRRSINISLESAPIHTDYNPSAKITISSGIASPVVRGEIRTANPAFPVPNSLSRPFGSANGLFPYRIGPLFCTARAFDGLWYRKHPSGCTGPVSNPVPCEKPAHFCTRGGGSARSGLNGWRGTAQNRVQREETDCAKQGSTTGGGLRGAGLLENYFNVYLKII